MNVDWNLVNNDLSESILEAGLLEELLAEIGFDYEESLSGRFRGPCPIHHGDGMNFEVRSDGDVLPIRWRCFSQECHRNTRLKPNLIGLVRGAMGEGADKPVSPHDARKFIERFLARPSSSRPTATSTSSRERNRPRVPRDKVGRTQVRNRLAIPSPYFLERGFSSQVLDSLDVGESSKLNRVVIPVYGYDGKDYVGYISRSTRPTCQLCGRCHHQEQGCGSGEPRWLVEKGFEKSWYLYNYAQAKDSKWPFVLLVEGAPDVFRASEADVPAVSTLGLELSVFQADMLISLSREIVVAFDNDPRGKAAAKRVESSLKASRDCRKVTVWHPPLGVKDVGEMSPSDVVPWINSRG